MPQKTAKMISLRRHAANTMLGTFAVAAVATEAVTLWFGYTPKNDPSKNTFAVLDSKPTEIFEDVDECVDKGHAKQRCEEAIAAGIEALPTFNVRQNCLIYHGLCDIYQEAAQDGGIATKHKPQVRAWQAARDDLTKITPLYSGTYQSGIGVRSDGRAFLLNR